MIAVMLVGDELASAAAVGRRRALLAGGDAEGVAVAPASQGDRIDLDRRMEPPDGQMLETGGIPAGVEVSVEIEHPGVDLRFTIEEAVERKQAGLLEAPEILDAGET